jgi:predicted DsbA family dithiol-disulfide isomerase
MIRRMVDVGVADGIAFDFDKIRPGNTFDAHRLLHFAAEHGAQERLNERLFRGYLSEGLAIGQRTVLANLAVEAGLDLEQVAAVLAGSEFADRVRADEEQAREYGIHGVPFFVLAGHYGVSGAQSADTLLDALQRAWQEREEGRESEGGATCGSDGCAQ